MIREISRKAASGYVAFVVLFSATLASAYWLYGSIVAQSTVRIVAAVVVAIAVVVAWLGFFIVNPNQAKVLQLFGKYVGTVKEQGLKYANPFFTKAKVSVRIRNFETGKLKVNDRNSNPIEIAAVVVWRVVDTAEAMFEVDDYVEYVHVQSEAAVRGLATNYAYDAFEEGEMTLTGNTAEIADELKTQIQERLARAGVDVIEARISHLAYAPEIASAMLQRQQASAIIAARQKIVEGAVGMVEMALDGLSTKQILHLDEERKAAMVSNLLVVSCSDRNPQPIVNAGSLY